LRKDGNRNHFIFRSLVLGKEIPYLCLGTGWVIAAIRRVTGKLLAVVVYGQGGAIYITDIILDIRPGPLQTW
jgi:hypothetical protein